jgi:hypothetical protein
VDVWRLDLSVLQRLVYAAARAYRTGELQGAEILQRISDKAFEIVNTARSDDGAAYARYVHDGTGEHRAPTGGGKQFWAWVDPPHARPKTIAEWRDAIAAGWGHWSRVFRARPARPWRKLTMEKVAPIARRMFPKFTATWLGGGS